MDENRRILAAVRTRDTEQAWAEMTAHQTRARDLQVATRVRGDG